MLAKYYILPILGVSQAQIDAQKSGVEIVAEEMIEMELKAAYITAVYWDNENEVSEINIDGQLYTSPLTPDELLSLPININPNQN